MKNLLAKKLIPQRLLFLSIFSFTGEVSADEVKKEKIPYGPAPIIAECGEGRDAIDWIDWTVKGKHPTLGQEVICKGEEEFFRSAAKKINTIQVSESLREIEKGKTNREAMDNIKRGFHAKGHTCAAGKLRTFSMKTTTEKIWSWQKFSQDKMQETPVIVTPWSEYYRYLKADNEIDFKYYPKDLKDVKDAFTGPVFGEAKEYDVLLRLSNGNPRVLPDKMPDFRGLAFKVMQEHSDYRQLREGTDKGEFSQDFLMLSNPRMVAGSAQRFMDFTKNTTGGNLKTLTYLKKEAIKGTRISSFMKKHFFPNHPGNFPDINGRRFWSGSAIRWGDRAARYLVYPCEGEYVEKASKLKGDTLKQRVKDFQDGDEELNGNYYRAQLEYEKDWVGSGPLKDRVICYDFFVQFQKDARRHSIEDSSIVWDEGPKGAPFTSTPIWVGQVTATLHELGSKEEEQCAAKRFNPWNGYEYHRPLGSINRIRNSVYRGSQELRENSPQKR